MCVSIYFGYMGVGLYLMVFGGMVRIVSTSLWCIWKVVFLLSKTIVTFLMPFFTAIHAQWIVAIARLRHGWWVGPKDFISIFVTLRHVL